MEYEEEHRKLIGLLRERGTGKNVLEAMLNVPRERFVPENLKNAAYFDSPLPIGDKQTISAPHMVAIMCDLLDIQKGNRILEIGAGSGYNAAVLAELTGPEGYVYSVERLPSLAESAAGKLREAGYDNVEVILADGSRGYEKEAPYDRICVTSAAPSVPGPLTEQLKEGGLLVIPVGKYTQRLLLIKKHPGDGLEEKEISGVIFVPLIGEYGFRVHEQ
jgi:protein-L-isoaspartate(D-aspartate) O-methyltransferase